MARSLYHTLAVLARGGIRAQQVSIRLRCALCRSRRIAKSGGWGLDLAIQAEQVDSREAWRDAERSGRPSAQGSSPQLLGRQGQEKAAGGVIPTAEGPGAPGGTRTPNLLIRSQALYPLSYRRRV
jgi:hypothetical protein